MAKREINMDYLRIFACFMVIFLHASAQNWHVADVHSLEWKIFNIYDCLVRSCVPLFFMISGKLFLTRKEFPSLSQLYKKNILKIFVIYILWTLFYAVDIYGLHQINKLFSVDGLLYALTHAKYHLWYLPALLGIYFLLPILWTITHYEDGKYLPYACIMFIVFGILFPTLKELPFVIDDIKIFLGKYTYALSGSSGYFLCAYYIDQNKDKLNKIKSKYLILLFLFIVFFASQINGYYAKIVGNPTALFYDSNTLFVFIEAIILFILFLRIPSFHLKKRYFNFIIILSRYTLFIYLSHVFVLEHLKMYFHISTFSFFAGFSVPLLTILVFVICASTAFVIDHIPFIRKWIM